MINALGALAWLAVVVMFGAVVPIVPTGAAVSGAAALAAHEHPLMVVLVVLAGATGAYVGDIVTFEALHWGGEQLAARLRWLRDPRRSYRVVERLRKGELSVLLVSRLVPGGRVPVLLAGAMVGLGWRRFAVANAPACLLWSMIYAAIGVIGRAVFPEPWQSVVAAVLLVLIITQAAGWANRRREG